MSTVPACAALGVYKPRRPQTSPLFRLVSDHFRAFHAAYDERFAETYGDWRPVVRGVADKFLECGVLDHGFARVRCDACTHAHLLAFSCKARYFCPSCHAKRLAVWTLWLEDSLLVAGVPHRQVVLTIPKRLRAWCLYRRTLLYVTKPFGALELLARVEALLRRSRRSATAAVDHFGEVEVNRAARIVKRRGEPVALTPREFDLLTALMDRAGTVVPRGELLKAWGYQHDVNTRTVDIHVSELRSKLEPNPAQPVHIITVKAGYRFQK